MHTTNPFRFPRTRSLLLRILNALFPPEAPTPADTEARINEARLAERQRLSQPLQNARTASPAVASAWTAQLLPTVAQLSPASPQRASGTYIQQHATIARARLEMRRQNTALARSVRVFQAAKDSQAQRAPTLHTLPAVSRPLQEHIDAVSRETPPEGYDFQIEPVDEDETAKVATLPASVQLRYWSKKRMA